MITSDHWLEKERQVEYQSLVGCVRGVAYFVHSGKILVGLIRRPPNLKRLCLSRRNLIPTLVFLRAPLLLRIATITPDFCRGQDAHVTHSQARRVVHARLFSTPSWASTETAMRGRVRNGTRRSPLPTPFPHKNMRAGSSRCMCVAHALFDDIY